VLGRYYDAQWKQAAPFQITPRLPGELHVVKRNFSGAISDFPIASFRESVPENENIDSFNQQLTGGFVGLSNGEAGLLLANARQISGSMAHCPMRLRRADGQDAVHLNPFGIYAGAQRVHPSRGNGSIGEAFVIVAPQARSLGPAFNGAVLLEPADSPVRSRTAGEDYARPAAAREARDAPQKLRSPLMSGVLPKLRGRGN